MSHFKSLEIEVSFAHISSPTTNDYNDSSFDRPVDLRPAKKPVGRPKKIVPGQAAPPVETSIPHHVNEVAALLKLSDEDLVDRMFPDPNFPPKDE